MTIPALKHLEAAEEIYPTCFLSEATYAGLNHDLATSWYDSPLVRR